MQHRTSLLPRTVECILEIAADCTFDPAPYSNTCSAPGSGTWDPVPNHERLQCTQVKTNRSGQETGEHSDFLIMRDSAFCLLCVLGFGIVSWSVFRQTFFHTAFPGAIFGVLRLGFAATQSYIPSWVLNCHRKAKCISQAPCSVIFRDLWQFFSPNLPMCHKGALQKEQHNLQITEFFSGFTFQ